MYIKDIPIIRTIGRVKILLQDDRKLLILEFPVISKIPLLSCKASLYIIIVIIGEIIVINKTITPIRPIEFLIRIEPKIKKSIPSDT